MPRQAVASSLEGQGSALGEAFVAFQIHARELSRRGVILTIRSKNDEANAVKPFLVDRFGDNGVISMVIGRMRDDGDLLIDTWLTSCRVLGRQVEPTTLNLAAARATDLGARRLIGEYIASKKNGIVRDHDARLGFTVESTDPSGAGRGFPDLTQFVPADTFIDMSEE